MRYINNIEDRKIGFQKAGFYINLGKPQKRKRERTVFFGYSTARFYREEKKVRKKVQTKKEKSCCAESYERKN